MFCLLNFFLFIHIDNGVSGLLASSGFHIRNSEKSMTKHDTSSGCRDKRLGFRQGKFKTPYKSTLILLNISEWVAMLSKVYDFHAILASKYWPDGVDSRTSVKDSALGHFVL